MSEEKLFLCKPCAERMRDMQTVKQVVIGRYVADKGDCEQCKRRRFGFRCTVTFKDPEELEDMLRLGYEG